MNDPLAIFLKEHDEALLSLKKFKSISNEIKKNGYSEKISNQLEKLINFIKEEITIHNLKEESALFPIIEKYVEGPTIILREEHLTLYKLQRKLMRNILLLKEEPKSKIFRNEFFKISDSIIQLMVNHIHKENQILFPLVKKFFTKKELKIVALKMI